MADNVSTKKLWTVIAASSAGTLIEWYDFYIFGSLAVVISAQFFPQDNQFAALLSTLAIFATGFIVRPFGALVFGRVGDIVGRKHAFLVTLIMMGVSTFAIGLVPNYSQIGVLAPLLVLLLRLTQGLALGGEYGGAATYVAEHAPDNRRGYYTSYIQTTATLGLLISILVIIACQQSMPKEAFESWGWRIPFLLSGILVVFSYLVRRKLHESPLFAEMKAQNKQSKNPWKDSFGNVENLRLVLLALFGATMGQGVVWYTGQFYALYFLQTENKVDKIQANTIIAIALVLATPLFIVFGALSDKVGRKKVMMAGCALAIVFYFPIFGKILAIGDVAAMKPTAAVVKTPVTTTTATKADKAFGVLPGDVVTESAFALTYANGATATVTKKSVIPKEFMEGGPAGAKAEDRKPHEKTIYSDRKLPPSDFWMLTGLVFMLVTFVTMVYGPIAAFLVELFPTRIRYSSMSLPYHIGNGVFGGLVPFIALWTVEVTHNQLAGLFYPLTIAAITLVVGLVALPDRRNVTLSD